MSDHAVGTDQREANEMQSPLRERLEQALAEAGDRIGFDVTRGNVRITIALEDGDVRWLEPVFVRVPLSRIEEFATR